MFNNNALGMVRQWQKLFSNCRYSETDIDNNLDYKLFSNCRYSETDIDNNLDYVMLGKAYGIDGYKVENLDELKVALNKADLNKPVIFECNINKDYDVYPIVPPNDALENLICN